MRLMVAVILLIVAGSCNTKKKGTDVEYHFIPFYYGKIYLERLPFNDEEFLVIDSAVVDARTTSLSFNIPAQEQSIFQLRIPGQPLRIYLINDADKIIIRGSPSDPKDYFFANEGYNPYLKAYIDIQKGVTSQMQPLAEKARVASGAEQLTLLARMDSLKSNYESNARSFADTTSNPAAFLFAYNAVDFGSDRPLLKQFILSAAKRFPQHRNVQVLKDEVLEYISIYEEELNIGDQMPPVSLPDTTGAAVPVFAGKGRFLFIDFWSTWCAPCMEYIPVKKQAAEKFGPQQLELISVAIDAEKDAWKQVLRQQQIPGSHFIDEKMWRGPAARTWKFDSIPYNFLVAPDGRIVGKAIPPDSLINVLAKFVK